MTDMPDKINVFVYMDGMDFMPSKRVLRVTDHTPPDDIDCELSSWTRTALVDELISASHDFLFQESYGNKKSRDSARKLFKAIAAIQGDKNEQ